MCNLFLFSCASLFSTFPSLYTPHCLTASNEQIPPPVKPRECSPATISVQCQETHVHVSWDGDRKLQLGCWVRWWLRFNFMPLLWYSKEHLNIKMQRQWSGLGSQAASSNFSWRERAFEGEFSASVGQFCKAVAGGGCMCICCTLVACTALRTWSCWGWRTRPCLGEAGGHGYPSPMYIPNQCLVLEDCSCGHKMLSWACLYFSKADWFLQGRTLFLASAVAASHAQWPSLCASFNL